MVQREIRKALLEAYISIPDDAPIPEAIISTAMEMMGEIPEARPEFMAINKQLEEYGAYENYQDNLRAAKKEVLDDMLASMAPWEYQFNLLHNNGAGLLAKLIVFDMAGSLDSFKENMVRGTVNPSNKELISQLRNLGVNDPPQLDEFIEFLQGEFEWTLDALVYVDSRIAPEPSLNHKEA